MDPIHDGYQQRPTGPNDYDGVRLVFVMVSIIWQDKIAHHDVLFFLSLLTESATKAPNEPLMQIWTYPYTCKQFPGGLMDEHLYVAFIPKIKRKWWMDEFIIVEKIFSYILGTDNIFIQGAETNPIRAQITKEPNTAIQTPKELNFILK